MKEFFKKYWILFVGVCSALLGIFLFKKKEVDFVEDFGKLQKSNDKEVKDIIEYHEEDLEAKEKNKKNFDTEIQLAEKNHSENLKKIEDKKEKLVKEILKNDNNKIASDFAKEHNFKVIQPKE